MILCFCQGPVFHAPLQVSPEQFLRDIPGLPGQARETEFSPGPGEDLCESLLEPRFQWFGSFPVPVYRVGKLALLLGHVRDEEDPGDAELPGYQGG